MVEGIPAASGGVDRNLQRGLELGLTHELIEPGGPKGGLSTAFFRQRGGRGDFDASQRALAFQRTGRVPGVTSCLAPQETQRSFARSVAAATNFRLVAAHRVHCHSAVTCLAVERAFILVLLSDW
jgi:hypothetical protein